jgi:hypothetical protein
LQSANFVARHTKIFELVKSVEIWNESNDGKAGQKDWGQKNELYFSVSNFSVKIFFPASFASQPRVAQLRWATLGCAAKRFQRSNAASLFQPSQRLGGRQAAAANAFFQIAL